MQYAGSIDEVRWRQVFPWLLLVSAARSAVLLSVVAITLAGALATTLGWTAIGRVTGVDSAKWPVAVSPPVVPWGTQGPSADRPTALTTPRRLVEDNPFIRGWAVGAAPWLRIHSADVSRHRIYLALCGFWSLVVWSIGGGAIAWITAMRVTRRQRVSAVEALGRALRTCGSSIAGPAASTLAAGALCVPIIIAGWLLRHGLFSPLVAAAWGIFLLFGAVLLAVLIGLLLGWPLMIITATLDRSDPFDGISRAFAYVYQRPLHLLWYLLVAGVLAWAVYLAAALAVEATIAVTEQVASVGAGQRRSAELLSEVRASDATWPSSLIAQWRDALRAGVRWLSLGLFWSLTTGIYLLLRFQIDETELDELADSTGP